MKIQRHRQEGGEGEGGGSNQGRPGGKSRTEAMRRKAAPTPDLTGDAEAVARPAAATEALEDPFAVMTGNLSPVAATIQRAANGDGGVTIDDVATAAVESKSGGQALDGGVKSRVEPYLGADLGGVRVHTDPDAAAASSAIGARAFAHQNDVFLGPGESASDVKLMAHELTHVVQQGAAARSLPQRKITVGASNDPAEAEADAVADQVVGGGTPAGGLIVEDGAQPGPGQMTRATAIAQLRAAAGPEGGPMIDQHLAEHAGDSAQALERMARQAAGGGKPATADELISSLTARMKGGGAMGAAAGAIGGAAQNLLAMVGGGVAATKPADSPAAVVEQLGDGAPLDTAMAQAAGETYGADLSHVRVHTGPAAARLAADHQARAFTIGSHVAFGAGEYAPGSAVGDAIMAHELAHVVQQSGDASVQRQPLAVDPSHEAEGEADGAATGVLARLYGGAKKAVGGVASRLRNNSADVALQRCSNNGATERLGPNQDTREISVSDFIAGWEKRNGRKMTDLEKETLSAGCIGITALNLGVNVNPSLDMSFSSFDQAKQVQAALAEILKSKPAIDKVDDMIDASPVLKKLKNILASMPVDPDPTKWKPVIFSKRFFSRQEGSWEDRKKGDPTKFNADKHGQVDMTGYNYEGRADEKEGPGNLMVNFDYGWYDETTDSWFHANHSDPGMKVYQSTLDHYSRPLKNFDRQIFCVAFAKIGK